MIVPPGPGIVIAEAVKCRIPNRRELLNQEGFAEGDPNVIHNEIAAREVPAVEIRCVVHALRVFRKPVKERTARRDR